MHINPLVNVKFSVSRKKEYINSSSAYRKRQLKGPESGKQHLQYNIQGDVK